MKVVRDLVEYYIDECSYIKAPNFKQTNIDFIFPIPCEKPDIEKILRVWTKPYICYKKLINTPRGTSLEGQNLTGNGILIDGDLNLKLEYMSDDKNSAYVTSFKVPFCVYIVLPELFNFNALVTTSVLIEDVDVKLLNERSVYCNITLMAIADVC